MNLATNFRSKIILFSFSLPQIFCPSGDLKFPIFLSGDKCKIKLAIGQYKRLIYSIIACTAVASNHVMLLLQLLL